MIRSLSPLIIFCITLLHISAYGADTAANKNLLLDKEIKNLQASYAAWQRNDTEFRTMREQSQSSTTDIQEFASFVAGLKRQVIEGCETVRKLGGDGNQHGVDCVKLTKESDETQPEEAPTIPARQKTGEEKKNALEEELETLIADFDELLLEQQETLKEQEIARQSSCSGGDAPGAAGAGGPGEEAEPGTPGDGQMPPEAEPGSGPGVEKQGGMPEFKKSDVGDGSDDDVVARQLREAAEAEKDPVLKTQLWKEYKKYKSSTR